MVYVMQVMLTACEQDQDGSEFHPDPAGKLSANLYDIPVPCLQWKTRDDGQRKCPKYLEFHSKNKFEKLVHLVGFFISNLSRCTVTGTSKTWRSLNVILNNIAVVCNFWLKLYKLNCNYWNLQYVIHLRSSPAGCSLVWSASGTD